MVYIVNLEKVDLEEMMKGSAKATKVRYLIDERQGADNFYLRVYDISPGGQTPYDQHPHEHEVFVLQGRAKLLMVDNGVKVEREVVKGDAIFIRSNEVHQFVNEGREVFRMLCVRGGESVRAVEGESIQGVC